MMTCWLVTVSELSVRIELVSILKTYDWSCEIEGVSHCYRITSGYLKMPKNGLERANAEIMYHARNLAGDAPVSWKLKGKKERSLSAKKKETQSKMKRMF